ncbi:hypothetical protein D6855_12355 [Butyrivibrio sp. CB08]|uniref:DUF6020 family protein n=1 Tax=Butyrivibrio sp. CB08 TaxID=2364879 RepID=UPI000EAA0F4C|nr:DUF6020 family protein [Butyrivibrio sp. CB08]RKM57835.1 hypothetical protein D6855_12355 [Butyrivibrio sp. CB08]
MRFLTDDGRPYSKTKCFFAGFLSAAALFVSFDTAEPYESHIGDPIRRGLFKLFEYTTDAFGGKAFVITLVALVLFFIYSEFLGDSLRSVNSFSHERVLAGFFSFMYVGGRAFRQANTLKVLIRPVYNSFKALIILVGFYFLFIIFIRLVGYVLENSNTVFQIRTEKFTRICTFYNKHPFLSVFIAIYLMWIPHLILRYPAAMGADDWNQLQFYFGNLTYSAWQPIFHTWLMGSFANVGMTLFGSANVGLCIYKVVESASMSAVLAYTIYEMYRWRTALWFRLFTLFLYCVTPYFTGNAAWVIKDYPHMIGYVMWSLCVIRIVLSDNLKFSFKKDWGLFAAWIYGASMMIMCRKNGFYIYAAMTVLLAVIWMVKLISKKERFNVYILAGLLLPFLITGGIENAITVKYNVVPGPVGEALCLPFQQTARYVEEHYDELTDEEIEVLSSFFNWEYFPTSYDPLCADDIKTLYKESESHRLGQYFVQWIKLFFKHPMSYIEATWNQSYFIFMPDYDNVVYNQDCDAGRAVADKEFQEWINIHVPETMQGLPIMVCSMYRMLNQLPFIALMNNLAIYVYIAFILRRLMKDKKFYRGRIAMIPIWLSLVFVVLAPMIHDQPRYSWAVIYILPTILAMYMYESSKA